MITRSLLVNPAGFGRLWWAALMFGVVSAASMAAEIRFQVQLVWGANDDKPDEPLKEVDSNLKEKLTAVFKWKHYYVVTNQTVAVAQGLPKRLKLSKKCEIEVQNLGKSWIEVQLFGEGKLVNKVKQPVIPPELLVIAGDDKNNTAWFVVLNPMK